MSEENKKPKEFEPIEDAQERLRYLVEGTKTLAQTLIWTQDQENVIRSHLTVFSQVDRVIYAWLPKDFDFKKFQETLAKDKTNECFFSISLPAANLFFKAKFLGHDTAGLKFTIPDKMFKVQRRKNVRFQIPEGHVLRVEFPDPLLKEIQHRKRILDISAGGISFLAGEEEAPVYQTGVIIKGARITVRLKQVTFDAEVRHTKPLETFKEKGIRVGVSFKNILPADSELVASYVFEESRKYFARFL